MRSAEGLKKVATINNPNTLQCIDEGIKDSCWGRVYVYYVRPIVNGKEGAKSNEVTLQRLAPMKITKINFFLRPLGPVNKICYYVNVSFSR